MKSIIRDLAKICYALLFLIFTKSLAQESTSFKITPELTKQIITKYDLEDFKIYTVTSKEVEYYPYIDGEVLTTEYKNELKRLEGYKPAFDEYNNALKFNTEKKEAIKTITKNIDEFLASDEKYEIKEKLLIESQALADKFGIKVTTDKTGIKLKDFINLPETNHTNTNAPEKQIMIYQTEKNANKNDLKIFKDEIQKIKISEPSKTNDYRWYLESLQELSTMPKTQKARVLPDKLSKKVVYVASEIPIDLSVLSGNFTELPEEYLLISNEIVGKFLKNELITESNEYFVNDHGFSGLPIFKKSGTDELFYIASWQFIGQLKIELEQIKYQNLGSDVEYKTWKTKYVGLLQSSQVNVNTCNAIIKKHTFLNRIGQKRYDSSTFTKQEKISFNKNLDSLNKKLGEIGELESQRDFLSYYNDKASNKEVTESYSLSSYYNSTSRAY